MEETAESTPESYNQNLTIQVLLPQGGEPVKATVVGWMGHHHDGRPIGKHHANPCLIQLTTKDEATLFFFGKLLIDERMVTLCQGMVDL